MSIKQKSIERNIMFSLLWYTVFTLLLLWAFQVMFLNRYYHIMQKTSIMQAGSQVAQHIWSEDADTQLERICFSHSMCCLVLDEKGESYSSIDMLGRSCLIHSPARFSLVKLINPVLSGRQAEQVLRVKDNHFRNESLVYAKAVQSAEGQRRIIILNASLDPVGSTIGILKSQLKIISLVLLLMALMLSKVVARRLSRPLQRITSQAKRLAQGEYVADYDGGGIAELDALAQTLNFSAGELSKVEDLRRELVANVSHDLKTPLTMIKAYAEMIRDLTGDDKPKRDAQLDVIISESDRLTALVTDLIRISRDGEQNRPLSLTAFDLRKMVQVIIERFGQTNPEYTILLQCEDDATVYADESSIGQVLYNLISNAINYTGADKQVTVRLSRQPNGLLRTEVRDTGAGIPEKELSLIWERYYRSRNTHQRPVAGSGLGLSIVRGVLTNHHAPFGVQSRVGAGSCFWFELPMADINRALQQMAPAEPSAPQA